MQRETIPNPHTWWRIADPSWTDPLNPSYAQQVGGRWNPPNSFPVLYLNEDIWTARSNLRLFIESWPYEPDDLRDDTGPNLVGCSLPRDQAVCDAHSVAGLSALGLPSTYPLDANGVRVPRGRCQPIGARAKETSLRGVRARSAQIPSGAGRELAWFPATTRSVARRMRTLRFDAWFRRSLGVAGGTARQRR